MQYPVSELRVVSLPGQFWEMFWGIFPVSEAIVQAWFSNLLKDVGILLINSIWDYIS